MSQSAAAIAFIFPGQGSQTVGMLQPMAKEFPLITATFAEASTALGYDLWELVQYDSNNHLNQTAYTQPALLTASIALWRVWINLGGKLPRAMAGHSLGEYSALTCAQTFDFTAAVKLVAARGKFMQEALPEGAGAMAAVVGLSDQQVIECCQSAAENAVVAPVNYNAIGQTVVAGHTAAVERVVTLAKQAGAKMAKLLPVSVPSHCSLMQPAADRLALYLADLNCQKPNTAVVNNVDVKINYAGDAIKDALIRQLVNPVRWVETIQSMVAQGITTFIECGPGRVLAGLNKRIADNITTLSINEPEALQQTLKVMEQIH